MRSEDRSTVAGSMLRMSYHTVGTAAARVALSAAMNLASGAAWGNRVGSSRAAPAPTPGARGRRGGVRDPGREQQVGAAQPAGVRHAPGVGVEHGHDRQQPVVLAD